MPSKKEMQNIKGVPTEVDVVEPVKDVPVSKTGYVKFSVYGCDHCKQPDAVFDTLANVKKHIGECVYNPANKRCMMCKHVYQRGFLSATGGVNFDFRCGKGIEDIKADGGTKGVLQGQKELNVERDCFELFTSKEMPVVKSKGVRKWEKQQLTKAKADEERLAKQHKEVNKVIASKNMADAYHKDPSSFDGVKSEKVH